MKILILILFLASCAGTPRLTIDRVEKDCYLYNVQGFGVKDEMPDHKVHVKGDKIGDYCRDIANNVAPACTDGYNIYVEYDHFSTTNHELCHIAYTKSWHPRQANDGESFNALDR